jgi:hypothetical protein
MWGAIAGGIVTGLMNKRSADKQMRFQDSSSRTQYQRAVADMKAAGINPMLSAKLGGNSAMSGAQSSMPDLGQTVTSAKTVSNQKKLVAAQTGLMAAQADQASANASLARTQASNIVSQQQAGFPQAQAEQAFSSAAASRASVKQINAAVEKVLAEIPGVKADSFIKQLSVSERQAMANVYQMMNGDVGKVIAFLEAMRKGGISIDGIAQAVGLTGLVKKYSQATKTKTVTHSRTNTPKGARETYTETWSE